MATYVYTPAPTLDEVKQERVEQIKREAHRLLQPTDWMVIRNQENATPIPQPILNYRAAVRAATDRAEQEIAQLATVEEVRGYQVVWPEKPGGI